MSGWGNITGLNSKHYTNICSFRGGALLITYQKRAEHVKTDEIHDGEVAPTGVLLPRVVIRLGVTELPREAGQHDLLPGLTCRTPFLEEAKKGLLVGEEGIGRLDL